MQYTLFQSICLHFTSKCGQYLYEISYVQCNNRAIFLLQTAKSGEYKEIYKELIAINSSDGGSGIDRVRSQKFAYISDSTHLER